MALTEFSSKVIEFISKIPRGKVATYGQIAKLAGKPQGARAVSWILHSSTKAHELPWHRVLGAGGKIAFPSGSKNHALQRRLLKTEGVETVDGIVDMETFQWKKAPSVKKTSRARPRMFSGGEA